MDNAADQLLELLASFGLGVLLVLGVGFYLFHQLKRESHRQEKSGRDPAQPK